MPVWDDGFHAETNLIINSGTINITESHEGLEGQIIQINGGNIKIAGGKLMVYGGTGIWQNPSMTSTQYSIWFSNKENSEDSIELKDGSGNSVAKK